MNFQLMLLLSLIAVCVFFGGVFIGSNFMNINDSEGKDPSIVGLYSSGLNNNNNIHGMNQQNNNMVNNHRENLDIKHDNHENNLKINHQDDDDNTDDQPPILPPPRKIEEPKINHANKNNHIIMDFEKKSLNKDKSLYSRNQGGLIVNSPLDSDEITVSLWIKLDSKDKSQNIKTILSNKVSGCEASSERNGFALYVNEWETSNQNLILEWGNQHSGCEKLSSSEGHTTIPYDIWTHVAFTFSSESTILYINGAKVAERNTVSKSIQKSNKFTLGSYVDKVYPFIGHLSMLTVWSKELTSEDIETILLHTKYYTIKPIEDDQYLLASFPLMDASKEDSSSLPKELTGKVSGIYLFPPKPKPAGELGSLIDGVPERIVTDEMKAESDKIARERAKKVVDAMKHTWNNYKQFAWGMDELKPISKRGHNNWGGMAVTMIDALDTLWLMGLKDDFAEAQKWIDSNLHFGHVGRVSFFETTIREFGGLLSAYELSGDKMFLDKAEDLGERLLGAFNTPSGIPVGQVSLSSKQGSKVGWTGGNSVLSELGTVQLEFRYLSKKTGNPIFADKANHVYDVLAKQNPPHGLYPIYINANNGALSSKRVTFGALGDSFFEYLLKVWIQGGKTESTYRRMYDDAMNGVANVLLQQSSPSRLSYVADWDGNRVIHKMDHLVCFLPGTMALGAYTDPEGFESDRAQRDLKIAKALMYTCYQMYARQPTGIAPEYVNFMTGRDMEPGGNAYFYILRPETAESLFILHQLTGDPIYRDWSWEMFSSVDKYCKLEHGYGAYPDVRNTNRKAEDRMESFWLGETLKYFYLIQDPDQPIDLMKYTFNTEAHPLGVFE